MKITTLQAALGSAALLLSAQPAGASHSHRLAHSQFNKKHSHIHQHQHSDDVIAKREELKKRGICSLPDHPDLVPVPGELNHGFAMSPDQTCANGTYCPIACVPGKVMAQWKKGTGYTYPDSQYGGLLCDNGEPVKPFPDRDFCMDGTKTVYARNDASEVISFCQTVLPGCESMLIPTEVQPGESVAIAVPGSNYWAKTAAHYYVNPPGTGAGGCIWGTPDHAIGNWAAYVAGANTVDSGTTFLTVGWNPKYMDDFSTVKPNYGIKVECPDGGCNNAPCIIDPSKSGINGVDAAETGIGNKAKFCVVTVPEGKTANVVVFSLGGSKGPAPSSSPEPKPETSAAPPPTTSSTSAPPTSTSTTSSSSAPSSSSTSSPSSSSESSSSSSSTSARPTVLPGIFHENSTLSSTGGSSGSAPGSSSTGGKSSSNGGAAETSPVPATNKNEGAADQGGAAIAGLIVAIVAAAALY
ncbi:hypothetical protein GE09DRAFT_529480 [Coniochaeta sp. 2T2.1]|nr:hypothetical protein GE09DRAFT_529480 [Coniochaeta sp. 2T2.1]